MEGLENIPVTERAGDRYRLRGQLRAALGPVLDRVLDMAELSGWDRRKAAYSMMFLAARAMPDGKAKSA